MYRFEAENGDILRIVREKELLSIPYTYTHFGIYAATPYGGHVIHYSGEGDFKGTVLETPLSKFLEGAKIYSRIFDFSKFPRVYSGEETVKRARSCIGRGKYDFLIENCENFAYWCKTGESYSSQTECLEPLKWIDKAYRKLFEIV